jgi:hypothetical protein
MSQCAITGVKCENQDFIFHGMVFVLSVVLGVCWVFF